METKREGYHGLLVKKLYNITLFQSLLIVFIVSFITYSNTLSAQFVYDDHRAILRNQDLRADKPWSNLFYNDFWGTPLSHSGSHKSYRPLCVLSFRVNYLFGELNSWGYHLVNNVLHAVVSCLFTYFCYNIYKKEWLSFIGGLLFAVHPIHTEAVAGIVGRADVGAAMFFLLSLICFQHSTSDITSRTSSKSNYTLLILCLLMSVLAMYTKELGITVLGVCVVYDVLLVSKVNIASPTTAMRKLISIGSLQRSFILTLFTIAMLFVRFVIMGYSPPEFSSSDNPAANHSDTLTRFLTFLYLPFCNAWLLIYPWKLSYDWSMDTIPLVESIFTIEALLSFLFYSTLFAIAFVFLIYSKYNDIHDNIKLTNTENKKNISVNKMLSSAKENEDVNIEEFVSKSLNMMVFSIGIMVITFLPATNLFFYVGFVIAERILYIPSIGFILLIINGLNTVMKIFPSKIKNITLMTFLILFMFTVKTYTRNFVWENEEALYRSGIEVSPAKSYGNLANILIRQNKLKEAESAYRSALRFRSNMADTHYNLGILLQKQHRYDEAIKSYKDAISFRPRLAAAHLNLGNVLMEMTRYEEALQVLMKAYNISDHGLKDPHMHATSLTNIRYNAGRVLHELQRHKEAVDVFFDAIKKMPDGYEPHSIYNMIGQCYASLENQQFAEAWYVKSLHSKANHVPALLAYAKLLATNDDAESLEEAEDKMKKAISFEPNRTESYIIFAQFLTERSRHNEAIDVMKEVFDFNSNDSTVYAFIANLYREIKDYENAIKYQEDSLKFLHTVGSVVAKQRTWMNLGAMYHLTKQYKQAMDAYEQAHIYDPTNRILNENIKKLQNIMKKQI